MKENLYFSEKKMEKFIAYNPTKLFFGKNTTDNLHKNIVNYGKKALLLFGKNSAKKYGYYNIVIEQLKKADIDFFEYSGIKPNPTLSDVNKAISVCKTENIDFIVALGGGSVIDSAKIIAVGYANDKNPWEIMKYQVKVDKTIPVVSVLTFAATGTEMNGAAVIQNHQTHEKIGYFNELLFPDQSYLDPTFTTTLPKDQTTYGIVDIVAHTLEAFFAAGKAHLSDRFVVALLKEVFEIAPKLLKNLTNYKYRARILWASTVALNGTMYHGRLSSGDWGVHSIGHILSYLFDTPHGATLSVTYPAWMKHLKPKISDRLEKLGFLLTGEDISDTETIKIIEDFFVKIKAPIMLEDIEICRSDMNSIKKYMEHNKVTGMNYSLNKDDYDAILNLM